jgi:hypothetical protein
MHRIAGILTLLLGISASLLCRAEQNAEYRIGLTRQGFEKLLPLFPPKESSRTDIYFDILCGDVFISKSLTPPFKLRFKQKSSSTTLQYSVVESITNLAPLNTPLTLKITAADEQDIRDHDPLLQVSWQFLDRAPLADRQFLALGLQTHRTFVNGRYTGWRYLQPLLGQGKCLVLPSGQNQKIRRKMTITTSDGTTLDLALGATIVNDANGVSFPLYELEADALVQDPSTLRQASVAEDLVRYLTQGQGLQASDISAATSDTNAYIQTQLLRARKAALAR